MNDLRFAVRQLLKNPGFTAVAVLTLALGIGANTAIFSFVNAILLQPLPYRDADRLVMVYENHRANGWFKMEVGPPLLAEWRKQSTVFEGLAAQSVPKSVILTGFGAPETLAGASLSANAFALLGVKPVLGRDFLPDEEVFGKHHVVLLSHELWQRRFGGDPNILGRSIALDSEPKTVIGILPPQTHFPQQEIQVWLPLAFQPWELQARHAHSYFVLGKLDPGVSVEQANTELSLIAGRMAAADEQNKGWGAEVHGLQSVMVGDVQRMLLVLLLAVGLVLLIGCANIANLLLARAAARAREFAIRAALGAGRGQLIRQLLTESLLLCAAGGVGGVVLAKAGLGALIRFSPPDLPRVWEGIHLDGTVSLFTVLLTLLTGLLFGLVPMFQATNPLLARELTESARGSTGVRRARLRDGLVVAEVALSVVLLIGAGLMIRSFGSLLAQDVGFSREQVVTMNFNLPGKKYPNQSDSQRFFEQLLAGVRTIPGVTAAGGALGLPLAGWQRSQSVEIVGASPPAAGEATVAHYSQISPGYFSAMGIPLLQGRDFSENDRTNTPLVLIVDETFVRKFQLGTNVLGRRVKGIDNGLESEIIGVVRDVKRTDLAAPPAGAMYRSYQQVCWGQLTVAIRTPRDAGELTRAVRAKLDLLDKDLPIENVLTMTQLLASSVAQRKLSVQLLSGFAGVALLLAALGLYGVLAYNVSQRTREIGIRSALGARHGDVIGLVLRQGMKLAGLGVLLGVLSALALTRVLRNLLYEVKPTDPLTFIAVSCLLVAIALFACWLPARRAARVDPMVALRSE